VSERAYWLDLFSHKTWTEFLKAGGTVTGFRDSRWRTAQRIAIGDYFLCYLTGVSRWIGMLQVTGKPFQDDSPIWADDVFPVRVPVSVLIALEPDTASLFWSYAIASVFSETCRIHMRGRVHYVVPQRNGGRRMPWPSRRPWSRRKPARFDVLWIRPSKASISCIQIS
jgi:hypothetical protein